jgi:plastocyanin
MKRILILILIVLAFSISLNAKSFNITISGFTYSPNLLTVNVGDEVVISASTTHPLRQVSKASWLANQTTELPGGWGQKTSNYTFNATVADTIYFLCAVHGPGGMKGKIIVLPATSVDNQTAVKAIYPNPANDFITVTLKPSEGFEPSEGSAIQIYNTLGEIVLSVGTGRDLSERIDISNLPTGLYYIKIGSETAKFVKM